MIIQMVLADLMAQDQNGFRTWKTTDYNGYIGIRGFYREQYRKLQDFEESSTYPFLYGGIGLYTRNYVIHPNFLKLNIGGEYNPGTSNQRFTISPDRSEVLNLSRLELQGHLFSSKPMNLLGYFNIGSNIINREYVSSMRTDSKSWGLKYGFMNKVLPVTISFNDRRWKQLEIATDREYFNHQKDFEARVSKSFTRYGDNNEATYRYNDFFRKEANQYETNNIFKSFLLTNRFYLDNNQRYMFRSYLFNLDQEGTINQSRFQLREGVDLKLPLQFRFMGHYELFDVSQEAQGYTQHRIKTNLQHKLFNSLRTSVFYDQQVNDHTAFDEKNLRIGGTLNYIKKIPTGSLGINYTYRRHNQSVQGDPNQRVRIIDEQQTLIDGQVVLLDLPYIQRESIIVKNNTGAIIYDENFDYILINHGVFVEIQRLPGGQIPNNTDVLVDYIAEQVGTYSFNSNYNLFNIRLNLLDNLLELYYTLGDQHYKNVEGSDIVRLNYFDSQTYGIRINLWLLKCGIERDVYNSSIVPYEKWRYYLNMQGKLGKKLLVSFNNDVTDQVITFEKVPQLYANSYGKLVYMLKRQSKIDLQFGYRKQVGNQIDLDMITSKLEFNTAYRWIYLRVGAEVYKRNYIGEVWNFRGVYFQLDRKF